MTDIKLNQTIYYTNKPTFTNLLKKLKLKWGTKTIGDTTIDGWFNLTGEYVQKLPESGQFKRFHIVGCRVIVDFLLSLTTVTPQPTISNLPTELPWELGKAWEYRKKQLLDAWDPDFKVKWS